MSSPYASARGFAFLRAYGELAEDLFQLQKPWLFPLYPKAHIFHHTIIRLRHEASEKGLSVNPMVYSCQMDEDVVGKTSRLSRRVSIRCTMQRTLERYLVNSHDAFQKAELIA